MSLSLQDILYAKRNALNNSPFKYKTKGALKALFSYLVQYGGQPQLQVVVFDKLGANVVLANVACKLYGIFLQKGTVTTSYAKFTDNATTGATDGTGGTMIVTKGITKEMFLVYPDGLSFANGIAAVANTAPTGSSSSSTDGPSGMAIIGGA